MSTTITFSIRWVDILFVTQCRCRIDPCDAQRRAFPAVTGNYLRWLLNTPLGQFRVNCIQVTEQTTGGLLGSSSEVYLCSWRFIWISTARVDIGWAERPDSIDGKRLLTRILQQAVKFSCR